MMDEKMMQILTMMNPELAPIIALLMADSDEASPKPKKKASPYNRRFGAAYKRIKKKNTLKSGKMKKSYAKRDGSLSKAGHAKIRDAAHKEAKR